ncbi:NfeD family protein [Falsiroseomonas sp.]|uniref:NfeD family protein n=1 Tax=Falsiroseomonas sp. TaxID=2870721 RepID=UPI003567A0DE
MGLLAALLRRFRWLLLAVGTCAFAFGVGYVTEDAALGMLMLLSGLPLALAVGAYWRLMQGLGPRQPYAGPYAHLIGQSGVVIDHVAAGVWVRLAEEEWPARLPPFAPRPPVGASVQVETVADDILIVRPIAPPA